MGVYYIVQPMGHGCILHFTTHGSWALLNIVQPMGHGVDIPPEPLYNPWYMDG